jgi:hypothetical protein
VSRTANGRVKRLILRGAKRVHRPLLAFGLLAAFLFTIVIFVSMLNRMPRAFTVSSVAGTTADLIYNKPLKGHKYGVRCPLDALSNCGMCCVERYRRGIVRTRIVRVSQGEGCSGSHRYLCSGHTDHVPIWAARTYYESTRTLGPRVAGVDPCAFIIAQSIASQAQGLTPDRVSAMKGLIGSNVRALWMHFYFWEALVGLLTGLRGCDSIRSNFGSCSRVHRRGVSRDRCR